MLTLRAVCFASALVCVNAFAQNCSGGADGGMDVNGNQCGEAPVAFDIVPVAQRLATPHALLAVTPVSIQRTMTKGAGNSLPVTIPEPRPLAAIQPGNGSQRDSRQSAKTVLTAKNGDSPESPCSGGVDGGMDATGNQCSTAGSADRAVAGR